MWLELCKRSRAPEKLRETAMSSREYMAEITARLKKKIICHKIHSRESSPTPNLNRRTLRTSMNRSLREVRLLYSLSQCRKDSKGKDRFKNLCQRSSESQDSKLTNSIRCTKPSSSGSGSTKSKCTSTKRLSHLKSHSKQECLSTKSNRSIRGRTRDQFKITRREMPMSSWFNSGRKSGREIKIKGNLRKDKSSTYRSNRTCSNGVRKSPRKCSREDPTKKTSRLNSGKSTRPRLTGSTSKR